MKPSTNQSHDGDGAADQTGGSPAIQPDRHQFEEPTRCACGRPIRAFTTVKDAEHHESGESMPYGPETKCWECRGYQMKADVAARAVWEALKGQLLLMTRPRLNQPYRQEWVDARKPTAWVPAKVWNRCGRCTRPRDLRGPRHLCRSCNESHERFIAEFHL